MLPFTRLPPLVAIVGPSEIKYVVHIASTNVETKLLFSLNTLGYIAFDVLGNLNCLEERLLWYADLTWFSRHPSCY